MNTILDTTRTSDWDSNIFASLYTESPIDMLRTTHYNVAALLLADLEQPTFVTWIKELADEHDCEPSDILKKKKLRFLIIIFKKS